MSFYDISKLDFICPVTRLPLSFCESCDVSLGGKDVNTGYLVSENGEIVYPVVDQVPQLIRICSLRGIPDSLKSERWIKDIITEVEIYDRIFCERMKADLQVLISKFSNLDSYSSTFPFPLEVWIDSSTSADTQFKAYEHLRPLGNKIFLQFGGSGTHAVKALIAGAKEAYLLSPSQMEIKFGQMLAEELGLSDRFIGVRGIGEEIPLPSGLVDRVYGGGCLHHTDVGKSIPEVYRILKEGGKASFVDPRSNWLYEFIMKMTRGRRFLGVEDETLDSPIDLVKVCNVVPKGSDLQVYTSGGPLRYLMIALNRLLKRNLWSSRYTTTILKFEGCFLSKVGLSPLHNNMAILMKK